MSNGYLNVSGMKWERQNKNVDKDLPALVKTGLTRWNQWLVRLAGFLQEKTKSYSIRKKKLLLLLFIIVFATESSLVLVQSMKGRGKTSLDISRIKTIPVQQQQNPSALLTRPEFLKIQRFKSFIDSLQSTAKGRRLKDSLLQNRPQLMDSINFLLNIYSEQLKKKENEK